MTDPRHPGHSASTREGDRHALPTGVDKAVDNAAAGHAGAGEPGDDAVTAAWRRAVAAARMRGARPGDTRAIRARGIGRVGWQERRTAAEAAGPVTAPGPDPRDPQLLGSLASVVVHEAGWSERITVAGVMARWEEVVGTEIAARCTPERFDDGVLVVRAATTAWATQLTFLTGDLRSRMAEVVGPDVVGEVRVIGPTGPSWRRGRLRAPGSRGPRDTYG